eukprot:TRINITY_DN118_c0_g1_i11.p1 TRINITY_DN118_c0_g1~~TRINITY_DN118_c0_g1_i11.p1  ORF type:complete len:1066 (+),score=527.85 TRINITY_DN118_c0_g1_i11:66-3200(+)
MADAVKQFAELAAKPSDAAAKKLTELLRTVSGADLQSAGFFDELEKAATAGKKKETHREAAARLFGAASADHEVNLEAYLVKLFPTVLELVGDKTKPVAKAGLAAVKSYVKRVAENMGAAVMCMQGMLPCLDSTKFQVKVATLEAISTFATDSADAVRTFMPELVPAVCDVLHDTKAEVSEEAEQCLANLAKTINNKDIDDLVPAMLKALMEPTNVPDCIFTLSCTKFVATVERPELALVTPLLARGFRTKETKIVRQSAKITDNLSKLVEVPSEAEPLLPKLKPLVEEAASSTSDPECRNVCSGILTQLTKLEKVIEHEKTLRVTAEKMLKMLGDDKKVKCTDAVMLGYASDVCESLFNMKEMAVSAWEAAVKAVAASGEAAGVAKRIFDVCEPLMKGEEKEEEEDAAELCNCTFTLAYGSKILLKNTTLRLLRGQKYGLLGANECGKTSLLKAIASDQVEGFPPSTEVRTVFVEADILGELSHLSCLDYIFEDARIRAAKIPRDAVIKAMSSVGFAGADEIAGGKAARIMDPVSSLSGGWRMKLALARAMLQKADILLMDDPTNHLDVKNVAWVEDYIKNLSDVTCLIVSSNPGLLQKCCSRIVHFDNLRLHNFKGSIDAFVEAKPEAKSYFELKSTKGLAFAFPDPSFIEGVTSRGKVLMKMDNVDFAYPGNPRPTVVGLTVRVSMASRVACLGPNGAGKSTMIKLLTGELTPATGSVWKHSNCKIAYVAQHAFHHIEKHLKRTPTEYILWRYEYGTDKESLEKATMVLTEEEEKKLKEPKTWEYTDDEGLKRMKGTIEKLTGIRKPQKRGGYLYEVRFTGKVENEGPRGYITEEKLNEGGWAKHVKQTAEKILAEEGRYKRPLTQSNVEKLLADVGLETEYASHYQMNALSGGQKVKVALAAAMWDQPHIVILDEPTNYLDRESLAALCVAIENFKGGVVIITHNDQFSKALCPETWLVEKGEDGIGRLDCKGDADWMEAVMKEKTAGVQMEEMVDALGNVTKVKQAKKELTRKERKQRELAKKKAKELGQAWSSDEDDM